MYFISGKDGILVVKDGMGGVAVEVEVGVNGLLVEALGEVRSGGDEDYIKFASNDGELWLLGDGRELDLEFNRV